jgi:hypothetical protein
MSAARDLITPIIQGWFQTANGRFFWLVKFPAATETILCRDNNGFSIPSALIFGSLFFFKIICGFCPGISHCIMMGDFRSKTKQPKPGALRLKRKNTK